MKCKHSMAREEIKACALTFGNCWINPPKLEKRTKEWTPLYNGNKPTGTKARDDWNYGLCESRVEKQTSKE